MPASLNRLKRRSQFLRTASAGLKWVSPGMIVQGRHRTDTRDDQRAAQGPGIGFTVSKKVGNAVERNRARRRLRAVADAVMPERAAQDFDYVLIGRKETLRRDFDALLSDLADAVDGIARKTRKHHKKPTDAVQAEAKQ